MAELIVGAGFGALAGELLKVIVNVGERAMRFKPVRDAIKKRLDVIIPVLKEIEDLNQCLGKSTEEIQRLKDLMNEGKQILVDCSDNKWWSNPHYLERPWYTKKLEELDSALEDFQIVLLLQIFRDQKKNTMMLKQIHDILNRPPIKEKCGLRKGISKLVDSFVENLRPKYEYLSSEIELSDSLGYEGYSNEGNKLVFRCYQVQQSKVKDLLFNAKNIQNKGTKCCPKHHTCANHAFPQIPLHLTFYHHKKLKGPNFFDVQLGRLVECKNRDPSEGKTSGKNGDCVIGEMINKFRDRQYEKIFHRTFVTVADEKLQNWFHCVLLTKLHGRPLVGILYVSTAKLAFCSHKPIPPDHKRKLYLQVVIQLELLKAVGISSSVEECIQVISIDNQEFRFTKFDKFKDAKICLRKFQ